MKKLLFLGLLFISLSTTTLKAEVYNVTAVTNNSFGTNYSVSLQVNGSCAMGSCYVSSVSAYTSYGTQSVTWGSVFGKPGLYYVTYNYETYYFRF